MINIYSQNKVTCRQVNVWTRRVLIAAVCGLTAACGAPSGKISGPPSCELIGEKVVKQSEGRDERFFKRAVAIDQFTPLPGSPEEVKCRGMATLSDGAVIPVHIRALKHDGKWMFSLKRGSDIK